MYISSMYGLIFFLLVSSSEAASIVKCKNAAGQTVFTDNPHSCADKKSLHKLSPSVESENFYNEIPDLLQTLHESGFSGDGQQFCAPVSVSNSLVWLEKNQDTNYQIDLVKKLASSAYMNTRITNGTDVGGVMRGVKKYALERWGGFKTLEYSGWRKVPSEFKNHRQQMPTINWMSQAMHRKGAVWLNVGWYTSEGINFRRKGGHWVTLTGYENGKLVIHDPSPRAGKSFSNQFLSVRTLPSGELLNGEKSHNARDFFIIEDGMASLPQGRVAIIDGAVKFELN